MIAALVVVLAGCVGRVDSPAPDAISEEEPFSAPDFSLADPEGTPVRLSQQRGRWVILNFWATWCAPCVAEMPLLAALAAERAETHILIGINVREGRAAVARFAEQHQLGFRLLVDPPDSLLVDYSVIGLPQTLVISPEGEIIWRQFGPVDGESFGTLLDSLISG
ncbi:MAG: TlpA family protein disulfide reductase [Anaerolineae bacterium]|nr:TlpA family protein disulfide reductase [Anaerolineae bacterium]NUQ02873.1 redoxin domain-containing protein [Anaerolineae bacterium]